LLQVKEVPISAEDLDAEMDAYRGAAAAPAAEAAPAEVTQAE